MERRDSLHAGCPVRMEGEAVRRRQDGKKRQSTCRMPSENAHENSNCFATLFYDFPEER